MHQSRILLVLVDIKNVKSGIVMKGPVIGGTVAYIA